VIRPIIPSRTDEYINDCLNSLEASQPGTACLAIVADNGIGDACRAYWESRGVKFVKAAVPFVFAQAINAGADAIAPGDDLLVLNDDTEMITPMWHDAAERTLRRFNLRRYGMISLSISAKENVGNHDQALDPGLSPEFGVKESRQTICFVAVIVRGATWLRVGKLDERFVGYGFDDNDYNQRVWESGQRVGIVSSVVVRHGKQQYPFSSSFARYNSMEKLREMFGANQQLMRDKHRATIEGAQWEDDR
jgi:GT2 family glycosyltransferase